MSFDPSSGPPDITLLLRKVNEGDVKAQDELFRRVHEELRRLAHSAMRNERLGHTLQPTALINEAFLRLFGKSHVEWVDRRHFFSVAGTTMRRVLIDYARMLKTRKNWGGQRMDLKEALIISQEKVAPLLELEDALSRLEVIEPRKCRVVELRYFAGLGDEEIAGILGVSIKTVKRDWKMARAWLHAEVG